MDTWQTFATADEATQVAVLTDTLRAIVADVGPDYCYPMDKYGYCRYVAYGQPACLVGVALHRLGFDLDEMRSWDEGTEDSTIGGIAPAEITPRALEVLVRAQEVQDRQEPWSAAVSRAMVHA